MFKALVLNKEPSFSALICFSQLFVTVFVDNTPVSKESGRGSSTHPIPTLQRIG